MFKKIFTKFSKEIGIDLGTSNTRVFVKEKGIMINEPTVVAVNTKTEQILAVGNEAKNMLGKTPAHIIVTRPLTNGVVSDYEVTEKMLKYCIDKVHEDAFTFMIRPRIIICAPLEVTEVEVKAIEDASVSAGARQVHVVQAPMAAAVGARMPIQDPVGNMVVDIGGGKTEVAVIALNGVVTWKSTKVAGDEMNRNIMQYARENFNMYVGESQAEQLKIKIGSAMDMGEKMEFPMRGRDVFSGLPREVMVSDTHLREAIMRSIDTIIDCIKMTLENTPPELTADIHERGLLLTGGGSLLRGIDKVIAKAAEIPVRISDDPMTAVVRGTGFLLSEPALLQEIVLPSARDNK